MKITFSFMINAVLIWDLSHSMIISRFFDTEEFFLTTSHEDDSLNSEVIEQRALICACITKSKVFTPLYSSPSIGILPRPTEDDTSSSSLFGSSLLGSSRFDSLASTIELVAINVDDSLLFYKQMKVKLDNGQSENMNMLTCLATEESPGLVFYISSTNTKNHYFVFAQKRWQMNGDPNTVSLIGFAQPGPFPNNYLQNEKDLNQYFWKNYEANGAQRESRLNNYIATLDENRKFLLCSMAYDGLKITDKLYTYMISVIGYTRTLLRLNLENEGIKYVNVECFSCTLHKSSQSHEDYSVIQDPGDEHSIFVTLGHSYVTDVDRIRKKVVKLRRHLFVPSYSRLFHTNSNPE